MDNLRWILLVAGLGIVLGIYLFSLYQHRKNDLPRRRKPRREAALLDETDDIGEFNYEDDFDDVVNQVGELYAGSGPEHDPLFDEALQMPVPEAEPETSAIEPDMPASPDRVFTLYVMAPRGVPFRGPVLLGALANAGLEFGDMQIYHCIAAVNGQDKVLFSAANIKEPGTFDLSAMDNFTTEGIVMFFQVPGAADGVQSFDAMVKSSRILANDLGSTVCDATRSILTNQTISHMREEVISYQLQQRVANAAS